jgi:hypothetical protein
VGRVQIQFPKLPVILHGFLSASIFFLNTRGSFGNHKSLIVHNNATPDIHYISKPSGYYRFRCKRENNSKMGYKEVGY